MKKRRVMVIFMTALVGLMTALGAVTVSASEPSGGGSVSSDLSGFIDSIKGALSDFTTENLATILVAALSLCVGLFIAWFAYRFIKAKVAGALKRGRM